MQPSKSGKSAGPSKGFSSFTRTIARIRHEFLYYSFNLIIFTLAFATSTYVLTDRDLFNAVGAIGLAMGSGSLQQFASGRIGHVTDIVDLTVFAAGLALVALVPYAQSGPTVSKQFPPLSVARLILLIGSVVFWGAAVLGLFFNTI